MRPNFRTVESGCECAIFTRLRLQGPQGLISMSWLTAETAAWIQLY